VCDKNCEKIHYIAPNIYCCGAGTAADTEKTTDMISGQLDLLRLSTGTQVKTPPDITYRKTVIKSRCKTVVKLLAIETAAPLEQ
jgi:20S proteasome subunit beta 2